MRTHTHLGSLPLLAAFPLFAQAPTPTPSTTASNTHPATAGSKRKVPAPTVFQADEGDRWTLLGDKPFIFKVDPVSTGSNSLVVGTEEMPPGNRIPTHKHLHEDEVIFVHKGAVRFSLADRQYDAGTGATIFIPHGNWIGVENASSEPAMILPTLSRRLPTHAGLPCRFA